MNKILIAIIIIIIVGGGLLTYYLMYNDPVKNIWSDWTVTEDCPSCGTGSSTSTRHCKQGTCVGPLTQINPCNNLPACDINEGWSEWANSGECTKSCGSGLQIQTRTCTKDGGICNGISTQDIPCNVQACPTTLSKYTLFSGKDFYGGDITGKKFDIIDPTLCADECEKLTNCKGFTVATDSVGRGCYLKSTMGTSGDRLLTNSYTRN